MRGPRRPTQSSDLTVPDAFNETICVLWIRSKQPKLKTCEAWTNCAQKINLFKIQSSHCANVPVGVGHPRASAEPLGASREDIADVAGPRQSDLDAKVARPGEVRCALQVLHPPEPFGGA